MKTKHLKSLLLIIIAAGFVYFFKQNSELVDKILDVPPAVFMGVALAFLVTQVISSIHLRLYFSLSQIKMSFLESFHYISQQSLGNYFAFSLGFISNMLILKKTKNLSKTEYATYMLGDQLIKFLAFGILLAIIIILKLFQTSTLPYLGIYIGVSLLLISPTIVVVMASYLKLKVKWIEQIQLGLQKLMKKPLIVSSAIILHMMIIALMSLKFYFISQYLQQDVGYLTLLTFAILTNVIKIASLVPGNLGIRESVGGSVLKTLGHTFENGVSLAIIDRIICTCIIFILGLWAVASLRMGSKRSEHASTI